MKIKGGYVNSVWVCESDLYSPAVIKTAICMGLVDKERITSEGVENFKYTHDELCEVLKHCFGFEKGFYTEEVLPEQRTRITKEIVKDKIRYFGNERSDKDWVKLELVEAGLCSREMWEMVNYGEIL